MHSPVANFALHRVQASLQSFIPSFLQSFQEGCSYNPFYQTSYNPLYPLHMAVLFPSSSARKGIIWKQYCDSIRDTWFENKKTNSSCYVSQCQFRHSRFLWQKRWGILFLCCPHSGAISWYSISPHIHFFMFDIFQQDITLLSCRNIFNN